MVGFSPRSVSLDVEGYAAGFPTFSLLLFLSPSAGWLNFVFPLKQFNGKGVAQLEKKKIEPDK